MGGRRDWSCLHSRKARYYAVVALALFALPSLRADVCRDIAPNSDRSSFLDQPHPFTFVLPVKPEGPAFRITIRPFPPDGWQDHFVHAGDVEVSGCEAGKLVQTLPIMAWQRINFGATFRAYDINFDGYLDISVMKEFAGKWASAWWWVYEPASRKFVQSELARELSELKSNGIDFDATKHEISTHELLFGCGPLGDRYRVESGRLVKIHLEDAQPNENGCKVTVSDLAGGNMRLTEVRLYDREGKRVK
jgi:hypothetical protein